MAERTGGDDPPDAHAVIPPDLRERWHYDDCGFLVSADGLLSITRPCPFEIARALEDMAARLRAGRKAKQETLPL